MANEKKGDGGTGDREREKLPCHRDFCSPPYFTDKCFESFYYPSPSYPSSFASNLNDSHSFCFPEKSPSEINLPTFFGGKVAHASTTYLWENMCWRRGSVIQIAIQLVVTNMGIYSAFFLQLQAIFPTSTYFCFLPSLVANGDECPLSPSLLLPTKKRRIYAVYRRHGSFRPMHVQQSSTVGWVGCP